MTADYDDIGEPVDAPEPPTDVVIEVEELGDEIPFADL
jgi:hypothetical protein